MNNSPANRQDYSPLGFANLENVAINNQPNHLLQAAASFDQQFSQKTNAGHQPSAISSTLSPLLNQLSLKAGIHSLASSPQQLSPRPHHQSATMNANLNAGQAYIRIVEQPARCALRFRYECEGRSAGSIPGCNSTSDNKTYPTIEIMNYTGPAVVVVSCVTKESPHRPHPHNLVGKEGCKKGVCTLMISNNQMRCTFTSLGIQCVKKKDIEESLRLRESIKVDPFRTGFAHRSHATIDLNVVRLCFQVFIEGNEREKFNVPLQPVVSDPIYDKKAMSDLNIVRLSHCSASILGGQEVILLCDRITKDDIQVKFFEEQNGQLVWEQNAEFQPNDVHKQVAIVFRVPKYYQDFINQPLTVYIQLRRPSDGHLSDARPFQYTPSSLEQCSSIVRKRAKFDSNLSTANENKKRSIGYEPQQQQLNEFRVPRLSLNPMQIDTNEPSGQQIGALQAPSFFLQQTDCGSPLGQPTHSPESNQFAENANQFAENTNFIGDAMMSSGSGFVKNESDLTEMGKHSPFAVPFSRASGSNRFPFGQIKEEPTVKVESIELDIDANDLISDINFNNMMINISSDNNIITFNSSGNIKVEGNSGSNLNHMHNADLQTPNALLGNLQQQDNNHF